jgi:hypothetical protein
MTKRAQPWRFKPGDRAYVRNWPPDQGVIITLRASHDFPYFPHYFAVDDKGKEWLISQLELSSKPING